MKKPKKLEVNYIYAPKTPEEIQEANKRIEEVYDYLFKKVIDRKSVEKFNLG